MPRPSSDDLVIVLKQKVFAATPKAIMVANQSLSRNDPQMDDKCSWIPRQFLGPKNQLNEVGDTGRLQIPSWVADQNDLISEP